MKIIPDVKKAIDVLKRGGVIIYPTDTVFGLGGNALDKKAVDRVFAIKNRPKSKPLPVIISNFELAKELAYISKKQEKILQAVWPGSVTVVLNKKNLLPDNLTANQSTIALRVPDCKIVQELASEFPIVGTSANLSGHSVEQTVSALQEHFACHFPKPDLLLSPTIDYNEDKYKKPSTILDLTGRLPKITRVGLTTKKELMEILKL